MRKRKSLEMEELLTQDPSKRKDHFQRAFPTMFRSNCYDLIKDHCSPNKEAGFITHDIEIVMHLLARGRQKSAPVRLTDSGV